jgi:hypothetical protein
MSVATLGCAVLSGGFAARCAGFGVKKQVTTHAETSNLLPNNLPSTVPALMVVVVEMAASVGGVTADVLRVAVAELAAATMERLAVYSGGSVHCLQQKLRWGSGGGSGGGGGAGACCCGQW